MKNICCLLLLVLTASCMRGGGLHLDDLLSSESKWTALEGVRKKPGKGEFTLDQGVIKVSGAVSTEVKTVETENTIFKRSVRMWIPSGQPDWASGSLTLFDKKKKERLNFMTIFKKPGGPADTCFVSIDGKGETPVKVTWDQWYQLKAEVSDNRAKLKIWREGNLSPTASLRRRS